METVEETIDVAVPVRTAYNQWTQFESFPEFMSGVESVTQLTDTTNHWVTKIGGVQLASSIPKSSTSSRTNGSPAQRRRKIPCRTRLLHPAGSRQHPGLGPL